MCGILRARLPPGVRVWVLGSRATATARLYSDIDLALEADEPIVPDVIMDLLEALSESGLPYKVDVIDLRAIDPAFRALIEPEMVALTYRGS